MIISFPIQEIFDIAEHFGLKQFVETGTMHGDTAHWASQHFGRVLTIELHKDYYESAIKRFSGSTVKPYLGDSPVVLKEIRDEIMRYPTLFFLDAHWSGSLHYGKIDIECPLLSEIAVINEMDFTHAILVDDVGFFYGVMPPINTPSKWPTIAQVNEALSHNGRRDVRQVGDNIFATPKEIG
jgi:hypothetical protein